MIKNVFLGCILFFSAILIAQENRVDLLTINGNKKIKTGFIEKIIKVKSGAVLDSTIIEEDIKQYVTEKIMLTC